MKFDWYKIVPWVIVLLAIMASAIANQSLKQEVVGYREAVKLRQEHLLANQREILARIDRLTVQVERLQEPSPPEK